MRATERELWLLNFYRNSELHGALLMGKLARTITDPELLPHLTRHCATEARHAALLTDAVVEAGGRVDPAPGTIQERYAAAGEIPTALADILVLSEILEARVLTSYRAHLQEADAHPAVRAVLTRILEEMEEEHGDAHAGWIDRALSRHPPEATRAAESRWRDVDRQVSESLQRELDRRFPRGGRA